MIKIRMEKVGNQHLYYVEGDPLITEGSPLPSCTAISGFVEKDSNGLIYWGIDQYIASLEAGKPDRKAFVTSRKESGDMGTHIHAEIEYFIAEKQWPDNPSRPFSNWYAAMNERVSKWIVAEQMIYHGELGYGGTADSIGMVDGKRTLFDWKTANLLDKDGKRKKAKDVGYLAHVSQLGGYLLGLEYMGEPVEQAAVVYIGRDEAVPGVEWKWVDTEVAKALFTASLGVYKATHKVQAWI